MPWFMPSAGPSPRPRQLLPAKVSVTLTCAAGPVAVRLPHLWSPRDSVVLLLAFLQLAKEVADGAFVFEGAVEVSGAEIFEFVEYLLARVQRAQQGDAVDAAQSGACIPAGAGSVSRRAVAGVADAVVDVLE